MGAHYETISYYGVHIELIPYEPYVKKIPNDEYLYYCSPPEYIYNTYPSGKGSIPAEHSPAPTNDTIRISATGLTAQQAEFETYRMPSWMGGYVRQASDAYISDADIKERQQLVRVSEELAENGNISTKNKQAMTYNLSNNMPMTSFKELQTHRKNGNTLNLRVN